MSFLMVGACEKKRNEAYIVVRAVVDLSALAASRTLIQDLHRLFYYYIPLFAKFLLDVVGEFSIGVIAREVLCSRHSNQELQSCKAQWDGYVALEDGKM
jgi:hypothetical protein